MSSLANVSIVGNLTRNPEKVVFQNGRKKTTLTVAVNNWSRDANDKEKTVKTADFYRVETWDKLAELTALYLVKGNQVAVSGKLSMDKWLGNDGKERMTPTVKANQVALPQRAKPPESAASSKDDWKIISKTTEGQEEQKFSEQPAESVDEGPEFDESEMPPDDNSEKQEDDGDNGYDEQRDYRDEEHDRSDQSISSESSIPFTTVATIASIARPA